MRFNNDTCCMELLLLLSLKHFRVAPCYISNFDLCRNMLVFYARIITEIIYANYRCMIVKLTEVQPRARIIIYNQDQIIGVAQ